MSSLSEPDGYVKCFFATRFYSFLRKRQKKNLFLAADSFPLPLKLSNHLETCSSIYKSQLCDMLALKQLKNNLPLFFVAIH